MKVQFREFTVDQPEYTEASELRNRLLRIPLGMDLFAEDRTAERHDRHFGIWQAGRLVACLVITRKSPTHVKLRQMCVETDQQGQGLGATLVRQTESVLADCGITSIELAARISARSFYEKLGFAAEGEEFIEVSIPHIKMCKLCSGRGHESQTS